MLLLLVTWVVKRLKEMDPLLLERNERMMGPVFVFVYAFVTFFVVYLVLEACPCVRNKHDRDRGEEPI